MSLFKNYDIVYERGLELVEFYRNNPCIAAYDLLRVDLAPIQRVIFEDMWFKNYVIVVASRGLGKSCSVDSMVLSDNGLVYLNEILPPVPSFLEDGTTMEIEYKQDLFTAYGMRSSKLLSLEKNIKGLKLTTENGFVHKGSTHHPLLVLDKNGDFTYKKLYEFIPGDRVCIQRGQKVFGKNSINKDDAYLVGLFSSDSCIFDKYNRVSITTPDEYILDFCKKYCNTNSIPFRVDKDKRASNTFKFIFEKIDWLFEKYNVKKCLSHDKEIPFCVRTSDFETQVHFLRGLFDAAGYIEKKSAGVGLRSVSYKLIKEVQMLLLNIGIVSKIRTKKTKAKFGVCYILNMFSYDAKLFLEKIGFGLERKQNILLSYFETKKLNTNKDTMPFVNELCKLNKFNGRLDLTYSSLSTVVSSNDELNRKLRTILDTHYYFDTVVSIEEWCGDCYDFQMSMIEEPNYFANGFINHNTFLLGLLSALSCMLYPGYRVGLIAPVFRQSLVLYPTNSKSYDTFWTSAGLYSTTEEVYNSIIPNLTQIQSMNYPNLILSKWKNEDRACRRLKTTKGFELSGTTDHSILVLNGDLDIVYKELQEIDKADYIPIKIGFNYFANDNSLPSFDEFEHNWRTKGCLIPKSLTVDLAYWMGLLTGDGCISISKDERKHRVEFVSEDQDLLDSFEKYLREYFLVDKDEKISRDNRKNNTWEIEYYCEKLVNYLLKCGFTKTTALDKKIPDVIKKASKEIFVAFLQGLFDTDGCIYVQEHGKNSHCEISFNTSSLRLAKEVQSVLLNLGIMSNLSLSNKACVKKFKNHNKKSKCSAGYKIRITGQRFITLFNDIVGFRCLRKRIMLSDYISSHFNRKESLAKAIGLPNDIVDNHYSKCVSFLEQGLYFVKIVKSDYFFAPTIDIEVANESCYWANGFINHNSKLIFAEVEKLYARSPILREATEKKPVRGSDTCYLKFKSVRGIPPSYIEALPLGDGSKIRGSRFYLIVVDELAQIPGKILDMVVRPMAATTLEPMENVRRLERQKKLLELGLAKPDDFDDILVNKMIMTSSGFYKFNHMWHRMVDYWRQIDEHNKGDKYAVWQVPYWDLPEGFLDKNNIEEAKRVMSDSEFRMEYEAAMISDSEGFFKASLLEICTATECFLEVSGEKDANYVLGVDPSQGGDASCGLVLIKLGNPNKIVNILELKKKTTQELTRAILSLDNSFNIVRIFMDKGGGGKAIMDLLEEGFEGHERILDRSDTTSNLSGKRILEMITFNPSWISDANFTTLSLLEDRKLLFSGPPTISSEALEKMYEKTKELKRQMLNIVLTQTSSGALHFDTPKKGQNKDLYSALILAAYGIRALTKETDAPEKVLYTSSGFIRPRLPNASWNTTAKPQESMDKPVTKGVDLSHAVLKKIKK